MSENIRQPKILLLNPPGEEKYIRDYFCAKISKAHYYYHPTDLIYLTGTLSTQFEVFFIDSIAEDISLEQCVEKITSIEPDWVVFLTAGISYYNDMEVLSKIHESLPMCGILGTGDIYREIGTKALSEYDFIDGIILDFSTDDVLKFFQRTDNEPIPNIIFRDGDLIVDGKEVHSNGRFTLPVPRWDLIKLDLYSYPFERRRHFASMLTDFGCPYTCTYCPLSTVGFKLRGVDEVIEEIELLKSLGVKDIYFRDQTFGVNKKRTLELCSRMKPLGMGWTCFTRVDVLEEERLQAMKRAGCHTVMFGIETTNEELLQEYKKNTLNTQVENAVELCKTHGIDVVGFFIVGLPGDNKESILRTLHFAKSSGIDFASFNVAMPRFGTTLRKDAIEAGITEAGSMDVDSSTSMPSWKSQQLSNTEIKLLQKKAYRDFYLRPQYLMKRITSISTMHQLGNFTREGLSLFLN